MKTLLLFLLLLPAVCGLAQVIPDSITTKLETLSGAERAQYLGDLCWTLREKNSELAVKLGNQGIELARELDLTRQIANISNYTGVVYIHYLYNSAAAIPYFHDALEYGLLARDTIPVGFAYNNLADAFLRTGNVPLALEYSLTSLDYFEKIGDPRGIAYAKINLGFVYRLDKEYEKSLAAFKEAIAIRRRIGHETGIASAIYELGATYEEMGKLEKAMEHYRQSLRLHEKLENLRYTAFSLNGIGSVHYEFGQYGKALQHFTEALDIDLAIDHDFGVIADRIGRALVFSKTGRRDQGEAELQQAFQLARQVQVSSKVLDTYEAYAKFYLNLSDYRAATESFDSFIHLYDSLYSQQQFETLAEVEAKFKISQRLAESSRTLELKQQEKFFLYIILSIAILFALVLYWRYASNKRLNKQLEELNASKDKLLSIIGHDLKNPAGATMNYLEILHTEFDELSDAERKYFIENSLNSSTSLTALLKELLQWGRLSSGTVKLAEEEVKLCDVINDIFKLLKPTADLKNITLSTEGCELALRTDKSMLSTVLRNLVQNAVKFTPEGGSVSIKATEEKKGIAISVIDTGVGMPQEKVDHLFTLGESKSTIGTAGETGTGLGLAICREFVEKAGGSIAVTSKEGEGSTFTIHLPS